MKMIHCFAKGISIGSYASFWSAIMLAVISMPLTFFFFADMDLSGYGASFVVGSAMMAFFLGLIIPIVPLVLAGLIAVCLYDKKSTTKSRVFAALICLGAFFLSILFFCLVYLGSDADVEENFIYYASSYTVIFFLPYLILFMIRLEKVIHVDENRSNVVGK